MQYKRVMLKLSGEGLAGKKNNLSIDPKVVIKLSQQVKSISGKKIELAIVIGGGNFWRGASAVKNGMERNTADYIGMLATIINALALRSAFENLGIKAKVLSSVTMAERIVEAYSFQKADDYLRKGYVVIFAGGTGRPFFTTDTTATLVAAEISADVVLMGKNGVDGVYDSDPKINSEAKRFETISYSKLLSMNLKIIDQTAASMARDNNIDILVFDIATENAIVKAIDQDLPCTLIAEKN